MSSPHSSVFRRAWSALAAPRAAARPRRVRRLALLAAVVVAAGLLAVDVTRAPSAQVTGRFAISAIRWYQATLSTRLGGQCRFTPTCSQYAAAVYARHGVIGGSWRTAKRIARCGPWTPKGTIDPPE
jgi:putative membrane protein insertion efficiency factor